MYCMYNVFNPRLNLSIYLMFNTFTMFRFLDSFQVSSKGRNKIVVRLLVTKN